MMPLNRSAKAGRRAIGFVCCALGLLLPASIGHAQNGSPNGYQGSQNPQQGGYGPIQTQDPLAQNRILPCPFPDLTPDHLDYLDKLLTYWEHSSGQIDMFECQFNRWMYDPVFGPPRDLNGELPAKTISSGVIKYKSPDKGMFWADKIWLHTGVQDPNAEQYAVAQIGSEQTGDLREQQEKWICDGNHIFEFAYEEYKMYQRELPPQMRGQGLQHGPLPFLFGAKKADLFARYWLRVITPANAEQEYWIEAYPKYASDAQNYFKVVIILDEADFLPKATEVFDPNFHPQTNPTRTVFEFVDRKIYGANRLNIFEAFKSEFFEPSPPRGWTEVFQPYAEAATLPDQQGTIRQ